MHPRERSGIVRRQHATDAKRARAREFRRAPTHEEKLLWAKLRREALGVKFRRQQVIDGFIVDFYCDSARLVIEIDGPVHARAASYDAERDHILRERGLTVIRIQGTSVTTDVNAVVERILAVVASASPPGNERG